MLPRTVPITTAAALSGYTPKTLRRALIEPGLVAVERSPGGRPGVVLASLERALARQFSADEYLAANRKLEPSRAYQSQYRQRAPHSQPEQERPPSTGGRGDATDTQRRP